MPDPTLPALLERLRAAFLDAPLPLDPLYIRRSDFESLLTAAAEAEALRGELNRRKGDPITRLHNLCEGLEQDSAESPFTAEEWERIDRDNVRLQNENRNLTRLLERAREALGRIHEIASNAIGPVDSRKFNLTNAVEHIEGLSSNVLAALSPPSTEGEPTPSPGDVTGGEQKS